MLLCACVGSIYGRLNGYASGEVTVLEQTFWGGIDFTSKSKTINYDYHLLPTLKKLNGNSSFGSALCHGDMNNDGLDDLIVGAFLDDSKYSNNGSVYIYYKRVGGEIYQKPPQRSAVVRQTRSRTIYELELLEQKVNSINSGTFFAFNTLLDNCFFELRKKSENLHFFERSSFFFERSFIYIYNFPKKSP